jgi:hypothetical protein
MKRTDTTGLTERSIAAYPEKWLSDANLRKNRPFGADGVLCRKSRASDRAIFDRPARQDDLSAEGRCCRLAPRSGAEAGALKMRRFAIVRTDVRQTASPGTVVKMKANGPVMPR